MPSTLHVTATGTLIRATRAEADAAIFRYVDGWYNPRRIQAGLAGLSPDEYEEAYYTQHDVDTTRLAPAGAK